ncbi:MAG: ubiquinone biosynthesis protein [Gammaproteobacteria bacterium]|nr:ubiquinone biosynthesis protein [Gammaproteobacteria bacterium]
MIRSHQPMQPLVAWRALRRLIADPQQTQEVFTVIRALSGPALQNAYERFRGTEVGSKIIREDIDLLPTLMDRNALSQLPANSFGRHYLAFVQQENITANGLVEASIEDGAIKSMHTGLARFETRQRDTHDLWHTLTQYGTDELGEICLLAFTYAQTKNRGIAVICLAGCAKLRPYYGKGVFSAAWRAYKDGKRTAWLPAQDWEALLAKPIAEVRTTLGIVEPQDYRDLRAQLAVA